MSIGRTNTGSGSSGMKLKIIGSLTAPSNPKENTIWLKTSTEITKFSLNKNGDAWISDEGAVNIIYESSSTYSTEATDKLIFAGNVGGIYGECWIKLLDCKISNGSTLDNVDAYVWNGSEWVQFAYSRRYLFRDGIFEDGLTFVNKYSSSVTGGEIVSNTNTSTTSAWQIEPAIDISNFTKLGFEIQQTTILGNQADRCARVGLCSNMNSNTTSSNKGKFASYVDITTTGTEYLTVLVPINGVTGLFIGLAGNCKTATAKIWLE